MHPHVRRHLIWQFEVTEQPGGCWRRAYFVNGKVKDKAYQLDQHIFPFLELLDYVEVTCDTALLSRLQDSIEGSLQGLLAREEDGSGLFATEESPADEALPLPYHFSSHVLMWYTLRRLAVLLQRPELQIVAHRVHAAVYRHFPTTFEGKTLFAYATDAHVEHMLYQDANDYPTVLAPYWGFCTVDDPIWQATIDFAFSAKNVRGYAPGSFGALGSIHTPGGWPLGNVQEYIVARIQGQQAHADAIMQRQVAVGQCDSALPETYDPESGQAYARHWFSWPEASTFHYLGLFEGQ